MTLSKRISGIEISPTMKVAQQVKEMQARGEDVIDLSVGELDYSTPPNVKKAAQRAIDQNFTKYTINSGMVELREAICNKLKQENGVDYSPNQIIVSNGAKQSIFNAIQSIIDDGDEVIFSAPFWVSYPEMVSLAQGIPVVVPTDEESGFKLTPAGLKKSITSRTKLLILCNPSNPAGSTYSQKELEEIAKIVDENNIFVISDEIYEKIIYDENKFVSFAAINKRIKERTILINGLSKSYAMTGWRIGYAAGPEYIIQAMNRIQSHSTSNASSISQAAAVEALIGTQDFIDQMKKDFVKRRDYMYNELTSIDGISCYKPGGAFYLFPNVSALFKKSAGEYSIHNSIDMAMYLLSAARVSVVPGSAFGSEGFIRLSYSASMEKLEEAVKRIKMALGKLF
ncbi:MAG TPA: pyridoxal phosphate-dependent aminotransferase [Melioribacteraceae bacterium]|nr:pyridoxal phosphate-dependent aminotransferase [Melioribacteraceae bacterium]